MLVTSENEYKELLDKISRDEQILIQLKKQQSEKQSDLSQLKEIERLEKQINLLDIQFQSVKQNLSETDLKKLNLEYEKEKELEKQKNLKEEEDLYLNIESEMDAIFNKYSSVEGVKLNPISMTIDILPKSEIQNSEIAKSFIKKNCKESFDKLLDKVEDINFQDADGKTMLMHALSHGFFYAVDRLLENNANVNITDKKGYNALMYACSVPHSKYVKLIADKTSDLNVKSLDTGSTALHCLVKNGTKKLFSSEFDDELKDLKLINLQGELQIDSSDVNLGVVLFDDRKDGYTVNQEKVVRLVKHLVTKEAKFNLVEDSTGYIPLFYSVLRSEKYLVNQISNNYKIDWEKIDKTGHQGFVYALAKNDTKLSKKILNENKDILKHKMSNGLTVLDHVVDGNYLDKIPFLIESGVDINMKNGDSFTSLYYASMIGNHKAVQLLLKYGAKHDIPEKGGYYPIHVAIYAGNLEIVKEFVKLGFVNKISSHGVSPLLFSIGYFGQEINLEIVRYLIENKANSSLADDNKNTPITCAAVKGEIKVLDLLLSSGADVNSKCNNGVTLLYNASLVGNHEMVQLLLKYGAKHDIPEPNGDYPIHAAIREGNLEIVKEFVKLGFVNKINDIGLTPLSFSLGYFSKEINLEIVKYLMENKADTNLTTNEYKNFPIHIVVIKGEIKALKILLDYKVNINVQTKYGNTPLYQASLVGNKEIVQLLLKCKAKHDIPNNDGYYPIHGAIHNGHLEVVKEYI
jgi:ankyrin repeat protein